MDGQDGRHCGGLVLGETAALRQDGEGGGTDALALGVCALPCRENEAVFLQLGFAFK